MSSARDEILARIRAATATTTASTTGTTAAVSAPRDYRHTDERPRDELVALFCERVDDYKAEVQRVSSAKLPHAIGAAAARHGARRLVIPAALPDSWRPPWPIRPRVTRSGPNMTWWSPRVPSGYPPSSSTTGRPSSGRC